MIKHRIYCDFNNTDKNKNIRLNVNGTLQDLNRLGIDLKDDMIIIVTDEELEAEGKVKFSIDENIWVACIDWSKLKYL